MLMEMLPPGRWRVACRLGSRTDHATDHVRRSTVTVTSQGGLRLGFQYPQSTVSRPTLLGSQSRQCHVWSRTITTAVRKRAPLELFGSHAWTCSTHDWRHRSQDSPGGGGEAKRWPRVFWIASEDTWCPVLLRAWWCWWNCPASTARLPARSMAPISWHAVASSCRRPTAWRGARVSSLHTAQLTWPLRPPPLCQCRAASWP